MTNWDPYPELQHQKNCNSNNMSENYTNCNKDCGAYKVQQNKIDANYSPLQHSVIVSGSREGYDVYSSNSSYNNLNKTWNVQSPYTL